MPDKDTFAQDPRSSAAPVEARHHPEKRAFRRVATHWQGTVILMGRPVIGHITDVSRGGMSFMCQEALPLQSKQVIFIRMPTSDRAAYHQLETLCRIVNAILVPRDGVYRMSAKFLELRGNAESVLMRFIHTHGG